MRQNNPAVIDGVEYVLLPKREFDAVMEQVVIMLALVGALLRNGDKVSGEAFAAAFLAYPVRERIAECFRANKHQRAARAAKEGG